MFSNRTNWHTEINPLSELLSSLKGKGEFIYDLTESNPTHCNFSYLKKDILKPLMNLKTLSYEPNPRGLLEAREAVCEYYTEKGIKVSPDQIFLTPSTSDAYQYLFRLLANTNDTVLSPSISYPLFDYLAELNDVSLDKYELEYKDGWQYRFEGAESEKAKAVLIVNPNNPTGNFVTSKEKGQLNKICKESGAALIVDEVFLDYGVKDLGDAESFAGNGEVLTFTLSGVSKVLGLPQMKLSWIVISGPEEKRREATKRLEIIADTFLSVISASQHALSQWLEKREEIQKEIKMRIAQNRLFLEKVLGPEKFLKSEGGWYSLLKLNSGLKDDKTAYNLLQEKRVYVHPGYFFDFSETNVLVLSLLPEEKIFKCAAGRMVETLNG